ncbi:hypothetical protein FA95DRAFT_1552735 [Auriscalpium vulgare]|uniref:Uncharacterized protein n=1 Tax=Auriscalpium vulgare TaxID=40419 RepID=A0ACB8SAQ4_9AGAM|nr:hypothetical protein FA95DRAFT_1552735 [Auriscalpium vulgare]
MSLVTKENAHLRPQWHVTALGRLIRPVRIRPDRPLDPPLETAVSKAKTKLGKDGKPMKVRERKRKREPPVRARRRTIDPLKWGSTHVQGVFLEGSMLGADGIARERVESSVEEESDGEEESDEEVLANETSVEDKEEDMLPEELTETPTTVPTESPSLIPSTPFPTLSSSVRQASALQSAPAASDLAEEKSRTLGLLQSIFGDADDDWGGVESVASDVDMDDLHEQPTTGGPADDWDVEFVPREKANVQPSRAVPDSEQEEDASEESDDDERVREEAVTAPTQTTKLKDLFKPQEDQGTPLLKRYYLLIDTNAT